MPTGYTAGVVDGKVTDFPTFAMTCARAFGALITMRDERMNAPIPDQITPSTSYYDKSIAEAEGRLRELQVMTSEMANRSAQAAHNEALASRARYLVKQEEEAARINAMLAQVRAWHPPTRDHREMKEFMIQQLTVSLPGNYTPGVPALLDGATWLAAKIKSAADTLARDKIERAKEIERAAGRTKWIKDLRESLKSPALAE